MNSNSGKQQSFSDREVDDQQQSNDNCLPASSGTDEDSLVAAPNSLTMRDGNDTGLADRLTDLLVGDSDLLMQRNTQQGTVVQWLQALDMQVMGACRAHERLKPLLKLNVSSVAEDRLLSHLSQHFEPSEVGLLARCLYIPLVSLRVGKINKQGTLLTPTSTRGDLTLSLLPTSDLRISFLADDGYAERLSVLRNISDCSQVMIEGIPADSTGRSFAVRIPNMDPFYFWCSEKSRLLGNELLEKMKDFLQRKPSLAELTGISDSRLQHFMCHLRTYVAGSSLGTEVGQTSQSPSVVASKPSRARSCSIQGILSPRPSSFKLRRRAEGARFEISEKHPVRYPSPSTSNHYEKQKLPESSSGTCLFPSVSMPSSTLAPQISPFYCWCPPVVSTIQYTVAPLITIPPSRPESFTLLPLSSLLAASSPNLSEIPFLPLSMSASSQQISMFTPLMCDPIVHVPVINICSSGQAYIVSGGPTITVSPLVQETESEKSARDTLRLLISGSSQFPSILANGDGNMNTIAASISAMGLVSPAGMRGCMDQRDRVDLINIDGSGSNKDDGSSEESKFELVILAVVFWCI